LIKFLKNQLWNLFIQGFTLGIERKDLHNT
jgi:hypothetical protein